MTHACAEADLVGWQWVRRVQQWRASAASQRQAARPNPGQDRPRPHSRRFSSPERFQGDIFPRTAKVRDALTWWKDQRFFLLLALAAVVGGCKAEIGDDCSVSTDCSNAGDRLCDTTQPGGYCTIFNCEPGTCPEEAICISFKNSPSSVCPDPQSGDRLRRTFCMRSCGGNDDCRSGYKCTDLGKDNPWKATVAEYGGVSGKVCIVPFRGATASGGPADICSPAKGCTAESCGGCCDALGFCRSGTEVAACGNAGGACTDCTGGSCVALPTPPGGACVGGTDAGSDATVPDAAADAASDAGSDAGDAAADGGDASTDAASDADATASDAATDS